jgi:hypothetical protein
MRAEQHTHVVHGEHLWTVVAVQVADELDGLGYQLQQLAAPQPRLLQHNNTAGCIWHASPLMASTLRHVK